MKALLFGEWQSPMAKCAIRKAARRPDTERSAPRREHRSYDVNRRHAKFSTEVQRKAEGHEP